MMPHPAGTPALDLSGHRYGRLLVLEWAGVVRISDDKPVYGWRCRCACGRFVRVAGRDMRQGRTRSCGCLHDEITAARHARPVLGPDGAVYPSRAAASRALGISEGALRWRLRKGRDGWRRA